MRRKTHLFPKLAISVFICISALLFTSLSGSSGILKLNIAEAASSAPGLTRDNPGIKKAIEVQGRHSERLMSIPGIVGHGIGISSDGEPVIKIFAVRAGIPGIPVALEGIPTKVEVTGMIVAYADPTKRFNRPVPIGVSTGHPDITAGTIGCRVKDSEENVYALSNNHVYADQNDAHEGDSALQPGPYDGGQDPEDAIGALYKFVPIDFSDESTNTVDAALASILYYSPVDGSYYEHGSLGCLTPDDGYGRPNSITADAALGNKVQKYGRTTGWTHGDVDGIVSTVTVCYETQGPFRCVKSAIFVDQIAITPGSFSDGGDSGSLIVTDDTEYEKKPVGLLFAGSNTHTFANPIDSVLDNDKFGVDVDNCCSWNWDNDNDDDDDIICGGTDCNDTNASINGLVAEVCADGVDNNCDGNIDEDCSECTYSQEVCNDEVDNDCDYLIDDADPDCYCPTYDNKRKECKSHGCTYNNRTGACTS